MVMAVPTLTEDLSVEALRNFFREKPFLFFGTGMSCAVDTRFGMPALQEALVKGIESCTLTNTQKTEWAAVASALQSGTDLENALNSVNDSDKIFPFSRNDTF
jgi:hypothetical protein